MASFAFVDVETTGGSPATDRIIEIGIVRVENGKVVDKYSTLVNPRTHIPYFIQRLTGINEAHLARSPQFDEVKARVKEITSEAIFVAHNATFDYKFLSGEFKRYNDSFQAKTLCTVRLSRKLYPRYRKHNLGSVIKRHGLVTKKRHRAYDDAHVLWQFYSKAISQFGQDHVDKTVKDLISGAKKPSYVNAKTYGNFPKTSGIYKFISRTNNKPIYIGKSKNLQKRINSHLTSASKTDLTLSRFTKDIAYSKTASEFGSLLLEAHEIKENKPILNRSLRKTSEYILAAIDVMHGYYTIKLITDKHINPSDYNKIMGVYKSKSATKTNLTQLCEVYKLCPKLLGLEKTNGSCFNHQIEKCHGACIKEESSLEYNIRFSNAFSKTRIKPWPYAKPIFYKETSDDLEDIHIFHNWCHLATFSKKGESQYYEEKYYDYKFDWDTYKIIKKEKQLFSKSRYLDQITSNVEIKDKILRLVGEDKYH